MFIRFRMFVFLFLSSIAFSGAVYAGEASKEHSHKTPHGGVVQETEGMHVEFLLDKNGEPKLFLYDKAMKPLDRDLQARLTVKAHDGTEHKRDLKFSKDPKEGALRSEEHTSELQSQSNLVCRLLLEKKKKKKMYVITQHIMKSQNIN